GLKTEIKSFNDYSIPNRALTDGEIDVNNFQHMMFLAEYNNGNNTDLAPVGATEILPLGLYYKDHSDLKDVEKAGEVAIPNDSTNQGRAINVLVQAGLVTLKKERSEEHTSVLQSRFDLVCRLLLEKKKQTSDKARS